MLSLSIETGRITKERAKEIAKLDKKCFASEAWAIKDWLAYTNENCQTIFIYDDSVLVAALAWGWYPVPSVGYLYSFAVDPTKRGQGLGDKLIDNFVFQSDNIINIQTLFAHTRATNTSSQKILKFYKFLPHSYDNFYYDDEDAIQWKREKSQL